MLPVQLSLLYYPAQCLAVDLVPTPLQEKVYCENMGDLSLCIDSGDR